MTNLLNILPFLTIGLALLIEKLILIVIVVFAVKAFRNRQPEDPLAGLGPGVLLVVLLQLLERGMESGDAIEKAKATGLLRVDHHTHLRCEICAADVLDQAR